eukprot:CAMPEP_0178380550 /NCGR_PEP_ID=MMETSP0689_2-20121128/5521_1 /TAXON_ID=160604 /ORGANISM="Amphidinium massartii, Strain CS-259" /LENGTH=570 /DNA_ID=CAMNT_0020000697 /DNA_START=68 /DNA_END=1778 /DNA_ORIENTATION=+
MAASQISREASFAASRPQQRPYHDESEKAGCWFANACTQADDETDAVRPVRAVDRERSPSVDWQKPREGWTEDLGVNTDSVPRPPTTPPPKIGKEQGDHLGLPPDSFPRPPASCPPVYSPRSGGFVERPSSRDVAVSTPPAPARQQQACLVAGDAEDDAGSQTVKSARPARPSLTSPGRLAALHEEIAALASERDRLARLHDETRSCVQEIAQLMRDSANTSASQELLRNLHLCLGDMRAMMARVSQGEASVSTTCSETHSPGRGKHEDEPKSSRPSGSARGSNTGKASGSRTLPSSRDLAAKLSARRLQPQPEKPKEPHVAEQDQLDQPQSIAPVPAVASGSSIPAPPAMPPPPPQAPPVFNSCGGRLFPGVQAKPQQALATAVEGKGLGSLSTEPVVAIRPPPAVAVCHTAAGSRVTSPLLPTRSASELVLRASASAPVLPPPHGLSCSSSSPLPTRRTIATKLSRGSGGGESPSLVGSPPSSSAASSSQVAPGICSATVLSKPPTNVAALAMTRTATSLSGSTHFHSDHEVLSAQTSTARSSSRRAVTPLRSVSVEPRRGSVPPFRA